MSGITKEQLIYDPAAPNESDKVGAHVVSSDGTNITHTNSGARKELDVSVILDAEESSVSIKDSTTGNDLVINVDGSINIDGQDEIISILTDLDGKITEDNTRIKILKAVDKNLSITYADFGTKNQRITQLDYTSTIEAPGTIARQTISYTLVGNFYRRDTINWTLV